MVDNNGLRLHIGSSFIRADLYRTKKRSNCIMTTSIHTTDVFEKQKYFA